MVRSRKGRKAAQAAAILWIAFLFAGLCIPSFTEVSAAAPYDGTFHLKKYVDAGVEVEATGKEEAINDPSNLLYGKEVAAGVVYEITRVCDYIDGELVEITPVKILDNGENYKTDANGEIHITGLPLGQYKFREVSAPEGLQANTGTYSFVLPFCRMGDSKLQYEVYVYPKNVRLKGSLSFLKAGDNGEDGLKNVTFEVFNEDGQAVTDEEGKALSVTTRLSGQATIDGLLAGKYYLLETDNPDTDYFKSSTRKYWFEVYGDGTEAKTRSFYTDASMKDKIKDADGKALADGVIVNYKVPDISKTASAKDTKDIEDGLVYADADGKLYANVDIPYLYTITTTLPKDLADYTKFEIYDAFGNGNIALVTPLKDIQPVASGGNTQPVLTAGTDYKVVPEGSGGYRLKFTEKGIASLAAAKCTAVQITFEAKIPAGYQVEGSARTGENNEAVVEFSTSHSDPSTSGTKNTVYPRAGEIIIRKVDKKDSTKLLAGAKFSLKDASGKEYWGSGHVSYLDTSGKETGNAKQAATFVFTQLPYGTYTLSETKAPTGYSAIKESITIKLQPGDDKTATWISHEETVKNAPSDQKQTDPPPGPNNPNNPNNQPKTPSLVKTGDGTTVLLYIFGVLGGGMVIAFEYRKRKKKA